MSKNRLGDNFRRVVHASLKGTRIFDFNKNKMGKLKSGFSGLYNCDGPCGLFSNRSIWEIEKGIFYCDECALKLLERKNEHP